MTILCTPFLPRTIAVPFLWIVNIRHNHNDTARLHFDRREPFQRPINISISISSSVDSRY